ncbi:MAG: hypothetical protein HY584_00290 [Candidatus Omnitrophica bacterium]|nr:hypothetical protein [Candidatus Omnitrophota bacterium]
MPLNAANTTREDFDILYEYDVPLRKCRRTDRTPYRPYGTARPSARPALVHAAGIYRSGLPAFGEARLWRPLKTCLPRRQAGGNDSLTSPM